MSTMAQIAKKAGVSPAVVSRVINGDKTLRIGKKTRERVEAVIQEMNYSPNVSAQNLASSQTDMIAMMVHDIASPVYAEILRGAQLEAARQNKAIILGDTAAGASSNARFAQMVGGGGVDALILQAAGDLSDAIIAGAQRQGIPIILLQADLDIDARLIQLPDRDAAKIATKHLADLGHSKIGCIATQAELTFTQHRLSGWQDVTGEVDDSLVTYSAPNSDGGHVAMSDLLDRHPEITGVVCFNCVTAIGALRAARERRLKVPDDLSVIAIHDVKFAQDLRVPLTVVATPLAEMGRAAVRTACTHPASKKERVLVDSPPSLILRQSTARCSA